MIPLKLTPSSVLAQVGKGCGSVGGSGGSGGGARDILMFEERAATVAKTCLFIEERRDALGRRVSYSSTAFSCQMDDGPLFVAELFPLSLSLSLSFPLSANS